MNRRLRLRILEQFGSQTNFAQAVGTVFTLPFPVRGHHHSQKISLKPKSGGSGRPLSGLKPPSTLFAVLLRGTAHEVKEKFSSEKAISPNPSAKAHSVPIRGLTKDSSVAFESPMTSRQDSAFWLRFETASYEVLAVPASNVERGLFVIQLEYGES